MAFSSIYLILALLTAIVTSFVAMPAIIKIATLKELNDEPDQERKLHGKIIPTLGGIGIFGSFLISFSIWGNAASLESYPFFVASLFMLFLIGVKDDILVLSPIKKLLVQILASTEIVVGGGIVITNLEGLFGIYQIPWLAGVLLTIALFVILINSYNLIDGIDGLAGGIGMIISGILGTWFLLSGFSTMAILSFVLFGALLGFLIFNFYPAKIFMGDTGAMVVGFIIAYMVVQFIVFNHANPASAFYINNATVLAIALLIIPVVDTLRVFTLRVIAGKNPLHADYNHLHHQFIKTGFLPSTASVTLWAGNIWVIVLAFYLNDLTNPNVLFIVVLAAGFLIFPVSKFTHSLFQEKLGDTYSQIISKFKTGRI